ncbi:hypothetical protein ASE21_12080 [Flavobacterium sp. Root901]|uniref:hypothetical protein n=1 Tax=Flavobacterium sp. Root901 TaxID=1736605 RepID=UPI00070E791C|nr:hypothetical protein [Flavobacterium sp. Root901]KRD10434.1 hypothetical protein ASE21_12080 [Flavobacterium sp. Root901]
MNEIMENSEDLLNDLQDDVILELLHKGDDDIKAGRLISFSDFKEKLRIKYDIKIKILSKYLKEAHCLYPAPIEAVSSQ